MGRLLKWTADYLQQQKADSPRLDAELLLAQSLGCKRIELYTRFDEVVADEPRGKFRNLVKQRASGMPVAYLLGRKEFYSRDFRVTPDVLIPRPETEHLVIAALDRLREIAKTGAPQICDVGTGSGCVAITLAKELPTLHVTAIEISPAALVVAAENAEKLGVAERIEFVEGDLLTTLPETPAFDAIVSNPPYIGLVEKPTLPRDVLQFEPHGALFSGEDGLDAIRALVDQAPSRLKPGGWLLIEFGPVVADAATAILAGSPHFETPTVEKDLAKLPRILIARRKAN
ncbi:peptide chain release factor N(5)-glutamine methyltransferase [Blastopirellula sp. JC732]|uniref:Release factor glutamine methyltransferase n=1 Tax=Blastopirellula sediminis TaxID=2894196 RepID=A0A9X1MSM8_9BACT|nr:peptide chain release factor N(5)-glutamine methyltransferase [Blastopirellula sediminis]MCC9604945.1 peptide chain release factor N(5)-glutamine methyltransferase [Blastopirellula sediminis]MCC9631755.1 peptide chain release factor N(5)-glutamine methyltransferase [Blastopirellula sediminis]